MFHCNNLQKLVQKTHLLTFVANYLKQDLHSFHLESFCKKSLLQSGASSHAKHGGAYFSAVRGSIKDLIAVPGRDEVQEC